jgi:excisionase family DNA binding protein
METMVTVPEVARATRLARSTVYEAIAGGRIRVVRFGRAIRVPISEAERLMRSGMPGCGQEEE